MEDNDDNKLNLTTKDVMKMPEWKIIKDCIDKGIEKFKKEFPLSTVELVDKGNCWWIYVDGVPESEIGVEDFKSMIN